MEGMVWIKFCHLATLRVLPSDCRRWKVRRLCFFIRRAEFHIVALPFFADRISERKKNVRVGSGDARRDDVMGTFPLVGCESVERFRQGEI